MVKDNETVGLRCGDSESFLLFVPHLSVPRVDDVTGLLYVVPISLPNARHPVAVTRGDPTWELTRRETGRMA